MDNQIDQNVSNVQPVHSNPSNDSNSPAIPKTSRNVVVKQTFGKCKRCEKNAIKTMHMRCRHITCCFTCADTCEGCPQCGLPSDKHFAIYAPYHGPSNTVSTSNNNEVEESSSEMNEVDDGRTGEQAADSERKIISPNECDHILIFDILNNHNEAVAHDADKENDKRDEPYDPNAIHTLGICGICLEGTATCFLFSESETDDQDWCGHNVCIECVHKVIECPYCRRAIISYFEAKDWNQ